MNQNAGTLGKKLGMTQIYGADGNIQRCTVILAAATVVGKRTVEKDGYSALILGMGERKEKHTNNAQIVAAKKANAPLTKIVRELRCEPAFAATVEVGATMPIDQIFEEGQHVDVQGVTRGRGFTGVMRRWNFSGFRATHGTHEYRRHGGSIGTNMTPGRTLPGLKMPGHYGDETVSVLNVKVAKIMKEEGLVLIEGGVPGAKHSMVFVRGAVKKKNAGKKKALPALPSKGARRSSRPGGRSAFVGKKS
jgi:large subunit ribosomal protein L3